MGNDAMRSCMDALNSINHCRLAAEDPTPMYVGEEGNISDVNGNSVGKWYTSKKEPAITIKGGLRLRDGKWVDEIK